MKKYIIQLLLSVLTSIIILSCNSDDKGTFTITSSQNKKIDTFFAGTVITLPITVNNKSNKKVSFEDVSTSCNCTKLNLSKKTISEAKTITNYEAKIETDSLYKKRVINVVISIKVNVEPYIFTVEKNYYLQ